MRASCTRDFNRASAASFAHAAVAPLRGSPSPVLMAANPPSAMVEGTPLPEGAIESRVPGGGGGASRPPLPRAPTPPPPPPPFAVPQALPRYALAFFCLLRQTLTESLQTEAGVGNLVLGPVLIGLC